MSVKDFAQRLVNKAWSVKTGKPVPTNSARSIRRRAPAGQGGKRSFAAGVTDRLTASFQGSHLSINEELRRSLIKMQMRSRELCENNDYAKKFLHMMVANVIGNQGIKLQCQFVDNNGKPDLNDQAFVEKHWQKWASRDNCSIDGKLSWLEIQELIVRTLARDGEVLIQKIISKNNGIYGLKLRVLECDHLDITHNAQLKNGKRIVMGIELDANDKPLAYWLSNSHPGDNSGGIYKTRQRIAAENIIHLYKTDRPGQLRGVPMMHSSIRRLNMLGGYEEAELVAARVGASKMGFYTNADGDSYTADDADPNAQEYDEGELVQEATPGTFEQLPDGVSFQTFDPQHPTAAFPDFNKSMLRGASSGLNVAYNTLANDLEGVNFSSIRSGVLEEREQWRQIQNWLADVVHNDIYKTWLSHNFYLGVFKVLPLAKLATKFSEHRWQPRGFNWVDPLKDIKASGEEYALGTTSLSEIAASKGKDLNDIFKQRQADEELAKTYGQTVGKVLKELSAEPNTDQNADSMETDDNETKKKK